MFKSNYIYLGLAISYTIVAIMQWSIPGTLPASLYVTISFVSLELSLLEFIKTIAKKISDNAEYHKKIKEEYIGLLQRNVDVLLLNKRLFTYAETYENRLEQIKSEVDYSKSEKRIRILNKIVSMLSCFQIVFSVIQFVVMPLKLIPYDTLTNKTLNVLSLISFALLFFSYFVNSVEEHSKVVIESQLEIEKNISSYYLNIIEKCQEESTNRNETKE